MDTMLEIKRDVMAHGDLEPLRQCSRALGRHSRACSTPHIGVAVGEKEGSFGCEHVLGANGQHFAFIFF